MSCVSRQKENTKKNKNPNLTRVREERNQGEVEKKSAQGAREEEEGTKTNLRWVGLYMYFGTHLIRLLL